MNRTFFYYYELSASSKNVSVAYVDLVYFHFSSSVDVKTVKKVSRGISHTNDNHDGRILPPTTNTPISFVVYQISFRFFFHSFHEYINSHFNQKAEGENTSVSCNLLHRISRSNDNATMMSTTNTPISFVVDQISFRFLFHMSH